MHLQELQPSAKQSRREAGKEALQLWETLLFVSIVMVVALIGITTLRSMRRRARRHPESKTVYRDIWEESARRINVEGESVTVSPTAVEFDDSPDAKTKVFTRPAFTGERPIVFVTGGAKRIGRAIVESFARSGCDIIFSYKESAEDAASLESAIRKIGVACLAIKLDLADGERATRDVLALTSTLPRLDVAVHNASMYEPSPADSNIGLEAMRHFRINALAPLMLTVALAPLLRQSPRNGGGCVICMSDMHAMGQPQPGFAAYSMSKAALTEMVYSLARELAPKIRVNGVAPGVVQWPEAGGFADASEQSKYIRRVPLQRAGEPSDAAEAVRWLALDAPYITGEIIRVDGGRHIT